MLQDGIAENVAILMATVYGGLSHLSLCEVQLVLNYGVIVHIALRQGGPVSPCSVTRHQVQGGGIINKYPITELINVRIRYLITPDNPQFFAHLLTNYARHGVAVKVERQHKFSRRGVLAGLYVFWLVEGVPKAVFRFKG